VESDEFVGTLGIGVVTQAGSEYGSGLNLDKRARLSISTAIWGGEVLDKTSITCADEPKTGSLERS
jgi:hypothetical protein